MTEPARRSRFRQWVFTASRSRSTLWKFALCVILIGTLVGVLLGRRSVSAPGDLGERALALAGLSARAEDSDEPLLSEPLPRLVRAFSDELAPASIQFVDALRAVPIVAPYVPVVDRDAIEQVFKGRFSKDESSLLFDYLLAWAPDGAAAIVRLRERAAQSDPPRYACYALGRVELKRKDFLGAYEHFRQEGEREDAREARYMAVRALAEAKDYAALTKLGKDARFAPYFTPYVAMKATAAARDYRGLWRAVVASQLESYASAVIAVAGLTGIAWAFFLAHLGELRGWRSGGAWLCLAGLALGIVSTTPTLYLVLVEDDILGFAKGEDPYHVFAYFIAGVGAREEFCKLLLFVPLLPLLLKRDDDLEALTVACFVGLGFAVEENGNYFQLSQAASAPGRFLTANFFHVALTGLNGLALFRAAARREGGLTELAVILFGTIVVHGAYDGLIELPNFEGGGFFATILYIAFAFYFFSRVRPLRSEVRMTVSLTGAFVVGATVLCATIIAFQMATLGARAGASLIFTELLGSAVLLFLFFREFNEPLAP